MIVKEREILSIPIKKNKFMEDYEFEQMKKKNDSNIQYNQKIYFKAPNNDKYNNQIIISIGSQKTTSSICSENQSYNNILIYVPCLNCGSDILSEEIEQHSINCTKVSKEIIMNDKSKNEFKALNYKLIHLKELILHIIQGKDNSILKQEVLIFGKDLYNIISKISNIEIASLNNIKLLKISIKEINDLENKHLNNLSISSLIIFDRTKVLINEKIKRIKEILRLNAKNRKNEETSKIFDQSKNKIDEIISDIDTKLINKSNNITSISNIMGNNISFYQEKQNEKILNKVTENNNDDENIIEKTSLNYSYHHYYTFKSVSTFQNNENNNEDMKNKNSEKDKEKKEFYRKVLKTKFEKLHSSHLGQLVSPKAIYNEAQKNLISKEKWDEFILNELQNPYKYTIKKIIKKEKK